MIWLLGVTLASLTAHLDGTDVTFEAAYQGTTDGDGGLDDLIELAKGAVVTGARVDAAGHTADFQLSSAATASATLDAYGTHASTAGEPRWVLGVKYEGAELASIAARAPHDEPFTATLAVTAPSCFYGDARYVAVPRSWAAKLPRSLAAMDRKLRGSVDESCASLAHEGYAWVHVATAELAHAAPAARIQVRAAQVPVTSGSYVEVEVALATTLADIPPDLATAIIVDTSRSLTAEQRASEHRVIASYLAHVPGTRVQAIAFARTPHTLLRNWMSAAAAAPAIERALIATTPQNGSDVAAALRDAAAWLKPVPGTRRILLLTDQRLDDATVGRIATLAASVGATTLVNVVALADGDLVRDDAAVLAPLASATGGIVATGTGDAALVVTPQALDHVAIAGGTATLLDTTPCGGTEQRLAQGTSCRALLETSTGPLAQLSVTGDLWSTPVTRLVVPQSTPSAARAVARHLVGAALGTTQADGVALAIASEAVSQERSLLVTWGSMAAERTGGGTGWGATCDACELGTIGHGSGTGEGFAVDTITVPALEQLLAACPHAATLTAIDVELTRSEIVDVRVLAPLPPQAVQTCIESALWHSTLDLPAVQEHTVVQLSHAATPARATTER